MTSFVFVAPGGPVAASRCVPRAELRDRVAGLLPLQPRPAGAPVGRRRDALEEYRKAQKLDPGSAAIRAEMARLLREAGKIDEALAEAREAVRLDKDSAEPTSSWPSSTSCRPRERAARRRCARRRAEYEEVVRLQPGDGSTLRILAAHLRPSSRSTRRRPGRWERYLALDPGSFEALRPARHARCWRWASPRRRRPRSRRRWSCSPARRAPTRAWATSTPRPSRPTRPSCTTARRSSSSRGTSGCA